MDKIIRFLASGLVASEWRATAVALACCCRKFEDPTLDALWREQSQLSPLLNTFPEGIWDEASNNLVSRQSYAVYFSPNRPIAKTFKKMPTTAELARFTKYSLRVRELKLNLSEELIPSNALSVLQLRTLNEPLLPNLKSLEFKEAAADIIPFIPLFLSPRATDIEVRFDSDPPAVMAASMVINLPRLCPHAQKILFQPLPRDPTVTNAASEMLLTCNLDALRFFYVDSTLTKEATQVVCQLPKLCGLWMVITESTSLPEVSLLNLTELDIEYHRGHDWLRRLHGMSFSKLTEVTFHAECQQVGAFLEAFEDFAIATSASAVLAGFEFYTSCPWNPNYRSLLGFKQLKVLILEFSCRDGCSSSIDDETLITLVQAILKQVTLKLGRAPCQVSGGVTIHGLIALAHHCRDISKLRVHFRTNSLTEALAEEPVPSPQGPCLPRENCALTSLEVGEIPILKHHRHTVVFALLRIFPRLCDIEYEDDEWEYVADMIKLSRKIDSVVHRSGEIHQPNL